MWCETHARPSRASANVFFCSAPTASSGGAGSIGNVAGTYPRERRMTCSPRSTESSVRVWIGRSCSRKRSAMPREALERVVVLVGDRLVGDVAAGHHQRHADVGQQQVMQRRVRAAAGRARPCAARPTAPPRSVVAADDDRPRGRVEPLARVRGDHDRERPVLAVLAGAQPRDDGLVVGAAREVEAADALDGHDRAVEQAPPRCLPSGADSRGPHAGQAFGWAWKRRSRGSSYSAWQAAHIVKPAIVVDGRSYGTPVTIVNRGPQLVQLMNGYR